MNLSAWAKSAFALRASADSVEGPAEDLAKAGSCTRRAHAVTRVRRFCPPYGAVHSPLLHLCLNSQIIRFLIVDYLMALMPSRFTALPQSDCRARNPSYSPVRLRGRDMLQDSLNEILWIGTALFALTVAASPIIAWYFHS